MAKNRNRNNQRGQSQQPQGEQKPRVWVQRSPNALAKWAVETVTYIAQGYFNGKNTGWGCGDIALPNMPAYLRVECEYSAKGFLWTVGPIFEPDGKLVYEQSHVLRSLDETMEAVAYFAKT